ncbi:EAL domain-containing protein [Bacillus tuaregi]|uniref:EAL domain-containing protein n=1 Tax=Bacillus tuaregi TaxID=1816695 RepID=UPI0008F8D246|nr:EAL domain-containing protein [Bacillus tuaregi]
MKIDEPINILLVDDRPENLLALEAIIEKEEYNLIKAYSGEEALKYLLKYDFAAILLDVQMPGMDGFGTAKIIKTREKTKNIPILFITANHMDSEHIFMGYSVGAIDYLLKPFDPFILKSKVEGFVELYKMKRKLIQQAQALEEKNIMIEHMAYHDVLTDLPNRRKFNEQLIHHITDARRKNQSLGILYLDMDRFKFVNDSLGHIIGDRLLQEIAKRLTELLRPGDVLARVDGDEFNMILPDIDRENSLVVAESVIEAFKEPFYIDQYELFITTSIGLCVFPYDGEDSLSLIKNADAALRRAKEQGKNKYKVFHSGLNFNSYRSFQMRNDLRKAIDRKELELVYQPRKAIDSGIIQGAEAIMRWNHPSWGTINAEEIIPIAEENGQIFEISDWVLKEVCNQFAIWEQKGIIPIRIAFKVTPHAFLQNHLTEHIQSVLYEKNVNPKLIEVEITEAVILKNENAIIKKLQQLRKMGVRIILDDFGTGYSSLNYVRRFPVDMVKVDKSFIADLSTNQHHSKVIMESISSLAKNFQLAVMAEGVDTLEQLNLLRNYHCQQYQGNLCSPPLLSTDLEEFLVADHQYMKQELETQHEATRQETSSNPLYSNQDKDFKQEIIEAAVLQMKDRYQISLREMDVFKCIISGQSNKEISEQLYISEHTVKNHITKILQKLHVADRVQAISMVYETCIKEGESLYSRMNQANGTSERA